MAEADELEEFRKLLARRRKERPVSMQDADTPVEPPGDDAGAEDAGKNKANKAVRKAAQVADLARNYTLAPLRNGKPVQHHDILFFGPQQVQKPHEMYRFPVRKTGPEAGQFLDKPELLDYTDFEQRRVSTIAHSAEWGNDAHRDVHRGIAFGTLPVKPEPSASSCGLCYLVNSDNLNFVNAWTAEEWNSIPDGVELEAAPTADATEFDLLIGAPLGKVLHLKVRQLDRWEGKRARFDFGKHCGYGSIESIDLRFESEVWNQLRNGVVAGRVLLRDTATPLPLVNVTSLMLEPPTEEK